MHLQARDRGRRTAVRVELATATAYVSRCPRCARSSPSKPVVLERRTATLKVAALCAAPPRSKGFR
jgi:hypothetical protein